MEKNAAETIKKDEKIPEETIKPSDGKAIPQEDIHKIIEEAIDKIAGETADRIARQTIEKIRTDPGVQREKLIEKQTSVIFDYMTTHVIQFGVIVSFLHIFYSSHIAPVEFTPKGLFTENTAVGLWLNVVFLAAVSLGFKFWRRKSKKKWQEIQDKLDSESDGNDQNDLRRIIRDRRDTLVRKMYLIMIEYALDVLLYIIFMVGIGLGGWCFCYPYFLSNKPMVITGIVISIVFMLVASIIFLFIRKSFNKTYQEIENKLDSVLLR